MGGNKPYHKRTIIVRILKRVVQKRKFIGLNQNYAIAYIFLNSHLPKRNQMVIHKPLIIVEMVIAQYNPG